MSAPRSESHDPFGGVQCGRARVSPHRFTITVIPAKRESTAAAAPRMQPEAIFRITYITSSSLLTGVWVVEEQRKSPSDASVHGRSRHALPRPPHPLGFGACLGRCLLACSETDQIVQCGAYRGDLADPLRRMTTGRLSLNPNSRFALYRLLHLCLLSAAFAWSGTTHTSMTELGSQRITHLQYLLRKDPHFPGIVL